MLEKTVLEKTEIEEGGKSKAGQLVCSAAALMLFCGLCPQKAEACENPWTAQSNMQSLAQFIVNDLTNYIIQEESLIDEKLTQEATYEMEKRLWEFDTNIRTGLSDLWQNRWLPAMMDMTRQLSAIQVDQTRAMGSMADAEQMEESINLKQKTQVDALRRYQPNEQVCQVDSMMRSNAPCNAAQGCGPNKAFRMARAMTGGYAKEDELHRGNYLGTPAASGTAVDQLSRWEEYVQFFCDPARGAQGCPAAGTLPGRHVDLAGLLWGDKQTIDMSQPTERRVVSAVQRYLISPSTPDPVPPTAVTTPDGQAELLHRRTMDARFNTIFNVVAQMVSERASGSFIDVSAIRLSAGLPPADTTLPAEGASYRELMEALTRDRFHNPEYIVRMVNAPEEVVREQGAINAIKMQQMNDLYKRLEEMVFMEAAIYADELDHQRPSRGQGSLPQR
ncbi:MAG: hypothetical protein EPN97_01795 [Alphaproteobacteria bacterium]|nr:MAG: hypothetical protein EPN97_01795 [Alphaproteobacteria bacterium]